MFFSFCVDVSLWCDELMLYNIYFDIKVDIWRQSPHPSSSGRLYFLEFSAGSGSSSATWKVITANVRTCSINDGWAFAFKYYRSFVFIPWVSSTSMIGYGPGPRAWGRAAGSEARAAQRGRTGTSSPPCTAGTQQITLRPNRWIIVMTINWSL